MKPAEFTSLPLSLKRPVSVLAAAALFTVWLVATVAGSTADPKAGERMYRDGILPTGAPMPAYIRGDILVDSTSFSCASCHMRGGLGSIEGGVTTPPTNGPKLYNPAYGGTILKQTKRLNRHQYIIAPSRRPAYTDQTLAAVLRGGVDPAGKVLDPVMPRYRLDDPDMAALISYLKSLSAVFSPGVSESTIRFATVIAGDVPQAERSAMLAALKKVELQRNNQSKVYQARSKYMGGFAEEMNLAYRKFEFVTWELHGPPGTWRAQLEEHYRRNPVFALVGGIAAGEWRPVHDFCEDNRIPALFPLTDLPVVSESSWYTLYFSKGYYQEGGTAARFIERSLGIPATSIVQVVRDDQAGRALSQGFDDAWKELGQAPVKTVVIGAEQRIDSKELAGLVSDYSPELLLIWDSSAEAVPSLATLTASNQQLQVMVSSGLLKEKVWGLPETIRPRVLITWPYRLPTSEDSLARRAPLKMKESVNRSDNSRIASRIQSLGQVLQLGVMHMKRNFYRDTLIDVISMIPDQDLPDYERLSFGPGQQYASKGCYIVQLGPGARPELIPKSDWVIH